MARKKIHSFLALALWFGYLSFSGCNYNRSKLAPDGGGPTGNDFNTANMDYKSVDQSVIGPRCASCHSVAGGNQGGVNLESYASIRSLIPQIFNRALEKRDMPPSGPLSEREALMLKAWLELGAPERSSDVTEKPDPGFESGPVTWEAVRTKIFEKKCIECHQQPRPDGALDLTDLAEVRKKAANIFDRVIIRQDMPISPIPALSMSERKFLLNWFNLGLPK